MAAITDLASLCEASGFEPEDLLGSTAEDLADLLEEYEVKGKAKIQVKKELRQLAQAAPPPSPPPPSAGAAPAAPEPAAEAPHAVREVTRPRARVPLSCHPVSGGPCERPRGSGRADSLLPHPRVKLPHQI